MFENLKLNLDESTFGLGLDQMVQISKSVRSGDTTSTSTSGEEPSSVSDLSSSFNLKDATEFTVDDLNQLKKINQKDFDVNMVKFFGKELSQTEQKFRLNVLYQALIHVGVKELKPNAEFSDSNFPSFLKYSSTWTPETPYCATFVSTCLKKASEKTEMNRLLLSKIFSMSTTEMFNRAETNKMMGSGTPNPGDILMWQDSGGSPKGHAEIIIYNISNTEVLVVSANSSLKGEDGVFLKKRPITKGTKLGNKSLVGFITYPDVLFQKSLA